VGRQAVLMQIEDEDAEPVGAITFGAIVLGAVAHTRTCARGRRAPRAAVRALSAGVRGAGRGAQEGEGAGEGGDAFADEDLELLIGQAQASPPSRPAPRPSERRAPASKRPRLVLGPAQRPGAGWQVYLDPLYYLLPVDISTPIFDYKARLPARRPPPAARRPRARRLPWATPHCILASLCPGSFARNGQS